MIASPRLKQSHTKTTEIPGNIMKGQGQVKVKVIWNVELLDKYP